MAAAVKPTTSATTVRNGVQVVVQRSDAGTVVLADCQCFGHPMRVHSSMQCPLLLVQLAARAVR